MVVKIRGNIFEQTIDALTEEKDPPMFPARGVSFIDNYDSVVKNINPGEFIRLVPDPENKFDPMAIRLVHDISGKFLGHFPGEQCNNFYKQWDMGHRWSAIVEMIFDTDSEESGKNAGIRMSLTPGTPDDPEEFSRTVNSLDEKMIRQLAEEIGDHDIAEKFFLFIREIVGFPETDEITDPASSFRVFNTGRILHEHAVDLSLLNEESISRLRSQMSGCDISEGTDLTDMLSGYVPDFIIIDVDESLNTPVIVVRTDHDAMKQTLWNDNERYFTLVGRIIRIVISHVADELHMDYELF